MKRALWLVLCTALMLPGVSLAQESCAPQDEGEIVDDHRLLRQLALDLLGRIPTMEEWNRLESGASIDEVLLPEMLDSEEYFAQVREQHRALLWGSLGNIDNISGGSFLISRISRRDTWRAGNMRRTYRGATTIECLDQPHPADGYDADGYPIPIRVTRGAEAVARGCDPADGRRGTEPPECREEGYVMVAPYWDPSTPVKVCAYDAQAIANDRSGTACAPYNRASSCGCGPNLERCLPSGNTAAQNAMRRALEEEPARIFEAVVRDGRSYLDAFTTRESYVNGASIHYYRHQTGIANPESGGQITYDPRMGTLPNLPFTNQDDWRRVDRGEEHAGVLTTMGYLLRFASNRGRANRFFTAFRCEPFVPPVEGLPEDTSEVPNPNLRERTGCASCHQTLERISAAWGRWRGNGTHGYLDDGLIDPMAPRAQCTDCGGEDQRNCSAFCNAYYVTGSNSAVSMADAWGGYPLSRAWLDESEAANINLGPSALVDEAPEQRRVASCAVRTAAQRLLGRDLTQEESVQWVPVLTDGFEAAGYNYTSMLRDILDSEAYRTIR